MPYTFPTNFLESLVGTAWRNYIMKNNQLLKKENWGKKIVLAYPAVIQSDQNHRKEDGDSVRKKA